MTLNEIENEVGAQFESITAVVPEELGRFAAAPREALKKLVPEKGAVLRPAVAISAAILGTVVIGAIIHRKNVWTGINALTAGAPGFRRRPKRGFDLASAAGSIAVVMGGSLVLAALQGSIGNKAGKSPITRGIMAAATAFGLDRLLLRRPYFRALEKALGKAGPALKYGAIGTSYALAAPRKSVEERDVTGGDISAGVPAM